MTGPVSRPVSGVTHDSRGVGQDGVFVAIHGARQDGHRYVPTLGQAAAVVVDQDVEVPSGVTRIRVPDTRRVLAPLAAAFHGHPGRSLRVAGITGTNGKTTTTWLVEAALGARRVGVIGTTGHRVAGEPVSASALLGVQVPHHTTPEAPVVQGLLAGMVRAGCDTAAMEVSSIALAAFRADAIPFRVALFTNLTRDHLDYHGTMEAYRDAKARLFHELLPGVGRAILNRDDPAWTAMVPSGSPSWTFGLDQGDLRVSQVRYGPRGTRARVHTPVGDGELWVPLPGRHNVSNALGALGIALALETPLDAALEGLARAPVVPGRLELVPWDGDITVVVDYAHTDDALARVLENLRGVVPGRIITVFGCGGDRDRGKRPRMGAEASARSDLVVVTSDNPRSEDPGAILQEILVGIQPRPGLVVHVEPDREAAIRLAIREAVSGDLVLVAGKGHETTQDLGDRVIPFDDRVVARRALEERP